MKTRDELRKECDELDQFCKGIDPEKLNEISLKTGQTSFTEEDIKRLGCLSKGNKPISIVTNKEKEYSHKEVKEILLEFKENFESNADDSSSDDLINSIHDPVCGCQSTFTSSELRSKLLKLKRCLEILCDYYCSDSILNKYVK
jgi:hypothetical protein